MEKTGSWSQQWMKVDARERSREPSAFNFVISNLASREGGTFLLFRSSLNSFLKVGIITQ
jgi:hypothetical protein